MAIKAFLLQLITQPGLAVAHFPEMPEARGRASAET